MTQVSVVIPTFNRADFLARAIDSVLAQTYKDFEVIVLDDGSTDGTEKLVRSCTDSRVKYHRHPVSRGAQAARNSGIRMAAGEYIAFLDSDDEWLPEKLAKQMKLFAASPKKVGVVHSFYELVSDKDSSLGVERFEVKGNVRRTLLERPSVHFSTAVARKECLERIGGLDVAVPAWQEWETFIRLSAVCEFDYVPEALVKYHFHATAFRDPGRALEGYTYVVKKHKAQIRSQCGSLTLAKHYLELTRLAREAGSPPLAHHYWLTALSIWPPLPVYLGLRAGVGGLRRLRRSSGRSRIAEGVEGK